MGKNRVVLRATDKLFLKNLKMKIGDAILWKPFGKPFDKKNIGIVLNIEPGFPEPFILVRWIKQSWGHHEALLRMRDCLQINDLLFCKFSI